MKSNAIKVILYSFPFIGILSANPPDFPSTPNQAPIGGLGLLAAAGGAMALKKIRNKKKK